MKKSVIIGLFSIGLLGLLLVYFLFAGLIRFNYPDKDEFPILGIDISHHQGVINWVELREEHISFVIIKATEGGDYKDPRFNENWLNSKREGYQTGAYHFYRLCKDGEEQAKNFIETVPCESNNLPPTVDLEYGGNCETDKSKEQVIEEVKQFLTMVEVFYKKRPIIYATNEFYETYLLNDFNIYPIWIRDIFKRPRLSDGREWLIWQFANRGHLRGIATYVDLNVLNGKSIEILQ